MSGVDSTMQQLQVRIDQIVDAVNGDGVFKALIVQGQCSCKRSRCL
jgi:hypothetical protein